METYYSQHGEDFLINRIFKGKQKGYYVEIGCLDGIEFSNTFYFENKGWDGLCIEAHRDFIEPLKRNRPKASVVHCAIGEEDKESVTFYANKLGSLSTLDKSEEQRWKTNFKDYFHGFEEQHVPMKKLTTVFDELKVNSIDFVSLDIEGYEVQALKGLDFNRYRPTIFIIEYKNEEHLIELNKILFDQGYSLLSKIGCNLFYSLVGTHKDVVNAPYDGVKLLHIDMDGNEMVHEAIHLNPTIFRRIKNRLKRSFVAKVWDNLLITNRKINERLIVPSYKKKRKILDGYRMEYDLKILVETGTFLGETVSYFKNKFKHVYSIELSEELYKDAAQLFVSDANVTIINGDSGEILKSLVPQIDCPAMYWLDGHYSHEFFIGDRYIKTAKGNMVTPILAELNVLFNDKHDHVILIDDARLFNGMGEYPTLDEINELANKSGKYGFAVSDDIIRIVPKSQTITL